MGMKWFFVVVFNQMLGNLEIQNVLCYNVDMTTDDLSFQLLSKDNQLEFSVSNLPHFMHYQSVSYSQCSKYFHQGCLLYFRSIFDHPVTA